MQVHRERHRQKIVELERKLALGAQAKAPAPRGPRRDEDKLNRLILCLDEGLSLNAMRLKIYPETPETAYVNTRQLLRRNRAEVRERCKPETVLPALHKKLTVT